MLTVRLKLPPVLDGLRAALFDMDGTILDSMGVWAAVDRIYFARRGWTVPADYARHLAGKSFVQSAEYTKERFGIAESVSAIIDEWHALCRTEYATHVRLKPHAREFLTCLRAAGVRLAVATALPETLYRPALENNGVDALFDAFASSADTRESKATGAIYRAAADMLNADAADTAVFEDILEGITGAQRVGMRAVAVEEPASIHDRAQILAQADYYLTDYAELMQS